MIDSVVQKYVDNVSYDDPLMSCLVSPSWFKEVTTSESEFLHFIVTPRIPARPDWQIRTGFRDARLRTRTLYLIFFFLKATLAPVGMAHIL